MPSFIEEAMLLIIFVEPSLENSIVARRFECAHMHAIGPASESPESRRSTIDSYLMSFYGAISITSNTYS